MVSKRALFDQGRIRVLVNALPCPGRDGVALVQTVAALAGADDRFELHALILEDQLAPCLALGLAAGLAPGANIRLHGLDHRCNAMATRLCVSVLTRQMSADVLVTPPDLGALLVGCPVFFISEPTPSFWGRLLGRDRGAALNALLQTPQKLYRHRPE